MANQEIKAIVFDCFGVLVQDSYVSFWAKHFTGDPAKMAAAKHADALANKKIINDEELVEEFARLAGMTVEQARPELEFGTRDEAMFDLIRELKPHYKIGFLSNANDNYMAQLFTADQIALFDAISISSESGFVKPEAGAFEDVARKLDLRMDECVFIDDRADYCEGANHVGMKAVHFTDIDNLKSELSKIGVLL